MGFVRMSLAHGPLLLSLSLACATTPTAPSGDELTFSIQGLECVECGKELEVRALKQPGVKSAAFDEKTVELHLRVVAGTDPLPIGKALEAGQVDGKTITAILGAGKGAFAAFAPLDPAWDARNLSAQGEDVADLVKEVSPGKATVVDFFADWCGPCHDLDEHMHALLTKDSRLAYRRINIVDWSRPVAKHYLSDVKELPFVIVYDSRGREVTRISGLHPDDLDRAIQQGEQP